MTKYFMSLEYLEDKIVDSIRKQSEESKSDTNSEESEEIYNQIKNNSSWVKPLKKEQAKVSEQEIEEFMNLDLSQFNG